MPQLAAHTEAQAALHRVRAVIDRENAVMGALNMQWLFEVCVRPAPAPPMLAEIDDASLAMPVPLEPVHYTGEICARCQSVRVVARGSCGHCLDCGNQTGGCGA